MNLRPYFAFLCLLSIALISCQKEPVTTTSEDPILFDDERPYPNADSRLWVYFEAFEEEAAQRGKAFDLRELNIQGLIQNIEDEGVAGHCRYGSHIDNEVTIDIQFWDRANVLTREFVVFHELGHCVLIRDHEESTFSNGSCTSIMRSGTLDCRDNYNSRSRASYLDELFSRDYSQ